MQHKEEEEDDLNFSIFHPDLCPLLLPILPFFHWRWSSQDEKKEYMGTDPPGQVNAVETTLLVVCRLQASHQNMSKVVCVW